MRVSSRSHRAWRVCRHWIALTVSAAWAGAALGDNPLPLWAERPPLESGLTGAEEPTPAGVKNVSVPTLTPYLVPDAVKPVAAVVVVPGGGYGSVCTLTEGEPPARWLVARGVAAFVLKYRLPNGNAAVPSLDARQAVRMVRERAAEWNVDPGRVGIWGFSAGGHLAATVSTATSADQEADAAAGVDGKVSARPDFALLFYPVISMEEGVTHGGSRKNLGVGDAAEAWSCDLRVTEATPPTFLLHAGDDAAVPLENGLRYLAALRRHRVPLEALLYETGGHGPPAFQKNPTWEPALEAWLRRRGVMQVP